MRAWALMLSGLAIWALHFAVLYAIASALPGQPEARWLVLIATVAALAAGALVLWNSVAAASREDPLDSWMGRLATLGGAIAVIAVLWQAAPALTL